MNDIIRKQMKDVIVPHNDIARRPVTVPEPYVAPITKESTDRIGSNPFFEKTRTKKNTEGKAKRSGVRGVLWALLFVIVLVGGFSIANYFATATIEIEPITKSIPLDANLSAVKEDGGGGLVFQFMSLTEEKTKEVPATAEQKIQKKASGKVVIFNAYNAESQRLIKNTRLEDNVTHKIFHIDQSVVVPGMKTVSGKSVPGSVEALVYADVAGKEYNIGTSNFTIPGFKGDPRYSKFTAASKADSPIGGGFSGVVKVPSDEVVTQAREDLKVELKKVAIEKARAQIPADVSFFPGSMVVKFEEVPQDYSAADTSIVSMRATVSIFFFDTVLLVKKITESALPEYKNNALILSNMPSLTFTFVDPVDNVVLADISKINFHLVGNAEFIGQIDAKKIQSELAGKSEKDFSKIIKNQNNISKANAVIRPMWKSVFPADSSKITIRIQEK